MGSVFQTLDAYDYLTFAAGLALLIAFFCVIMFILGLPGSIARKRNHPHAEAVNLMGWVGFLAVVPWIHALIWAYHDGVTVDIRERLTPTNDPPPPTVPDAAPPVPRSPT